MKYYSDVNSHLILTSINRLTLILNFIFFLLFFSHFWGLQLILPMLLLVATRLLWRTPWPSWHWRTTFLICFIYHTVVVDVLIELCNNVWFYPRYSSLISALLWMVKKGNEK